jgi:hypothetical protein
MSRIHPCVAIALAAFAAAPEAMGAPFTVSYTDGASWNTVFAQGFSPAVGADPVPGLAAGDAVYLEQFQFFKSGTADSAANVQLAILNNLFADLTGLSTSSAAFVGLSENSVASTAGTSTGGPITFDFSGLPLTYGSNYGAVFVNVGAGGELTPVLVSALTANYVDAGDGTFHPATNYGTENQFEYATSNFITTNEFGQFFSTFSFAGDANFVATLNVVPEAHTLVLMSGGLALIVAAVRRRNS